MKINTYYIAKELIYMLKNWWNWEKKSFIYVMFRVPAIIFLPVITSLVPKVIIDLILSKCSIEKMVLHVIVLSMLIAGLSWISPYLYERIAGSAQIIRKRYIVKLFKKTMTVSYMFIESFEGRKKIELAKQFVNGTLSASAFFINIFGRFMVNILGIVTYSLILQEIQNSIMFVIITTSVCEGIIILLLDRLKDRMTAEESKFHMMYDYLFNKSYDLSSGKDIRVFNFSNLFLSLLETINIKHIELISSFTKQKINSNVYRGLFSLVREMFCYIHLFNLVLTEKISISEFIFCFGIIGGLSSWILGISEEYKNLVFCCRHSKRYRDFIGLDETIGNIKKNISRINKTYNIPEIVFDNVSFKYNDNSDYALKDINLTIAANTNVAIVGENGAGKTTLIKLLTGLYKPTKGNITIDKINLDEFEQEECSDLISAIYQDYYLFPMSIAENICLCNTKEIDYDKLYDCLKKVSLYDKIMSLENNIYTKICKNVLENATELSGGETQRLLLARALYKGAPILIFDEPTAALDAISEDNLYKNFSEISTNKTSIYISHRLSSTKFCDLIIYMANGKIIEKGTHEELMKLKGEYFQQYFIQSYYYNENNMDL